MAVLHRATIVPSKAEALAAWLPAQPWSGLSSGEAITVVGQFRFDDPAGEVGVETMLVGTEDGRVLHAPLTYRGAPLAGAEEHLVTQMQHSALGQRWVYDAAGDPVYADVVRRAIATGGSHADLVSAETGAPIDREGSAVGSGSAGDSPTVTRAEPTTTGTTTAVHTDHGDLVVVRVVGEDVPDGEALTGIWGGGTSAVLVALHA